MSEEYPDGFHSGHASMLADSTPIDEQCLDPSQACYECGERMISRCACGMPLCSRHAETQAGFCSDHVAVETDKGQIPACIRPEYDPEADQDLQVIPNTRAYAIETETEDPDADELEAAVRGALPEALIDRARESVDKARDRDLDDKRILQHLASASDALAFATADGVDDQEAWLETAHEILTQLPEQLDDQYGVGSDCHIAVGYLEQLGVDSGGDGQ